MRFLPYIRLSYKSLLTGTAFFAIYPFIVQISARWRCVFCHIPVYRTNLCSMRLRFMPYNHLSHKSLLAGTAFFAIYPFIAQISARWDCVFCHIPVYRTNLCSLGLRFLPYTHLSNKSLLAGTTFFAIYPFIAQTSARWDCVFCHIPIYRINLFSLGLRFLPYIHLSHKPLLARTAFFAIYPFIIQISARWRCVLCHISIYRTNLFSLRLRFLPYTHLSYKSLLDGDAFFAIYPFIAQISSGWDCVLCDKTTDRISTFTK